MSERNLEYLDPVLEETRLSEYEKAKLRKFRHGAVQLEEDTLSLLQTITGKFKRKTDENRDLNSSDIKDAITVADASVRYLRLMRETRLASEKLALQAAQGNKSALNAGDMGPRELEAFMKAAIAKLGADKVRALLPADIIQE